MLDDTPSSNSARYSTADSGVMSSSDMERGLDVARTMGSRPHSEPSRSVNVDMQVGGFPYYTTTLSLSNAHPDPPRDSGGSPYYTTMMPYSVLRQSRNRQPADDITKIGGMESGVAHSKEGDTNHDSILSMESRQTSSSPVYSKVKKRGRKGRGNEGGRKKEEEEGEGDKEEEEQCGEEKGEKDEKEREKVEERNIKNEGVQEEKKQPRPSQL